MDSKQLKMILVVCASLVGCQQRMDGSELVAVEANALGITQVEIQHGFQDGDRLLTIRGLDDSENELALTTLRTGKVLYSSEPDVMPEMWSEGTELTFSRPSSSFTSITPDRLPHEARVPHGEIEDLVGIQAVATAIRAEAGIWFAHPESENGSESAYSGGPVGTSNCSGSKFPTTVSVVISNVTQQLNGSPLECCAEAGFTFHKIRNGGVNQANQNKLGYRSYLPSGAVCRKSNGTAPCDGSQGDCSYGPCGGRNETITPASGNTADAAVFGAHEGIVFHCGYDSNGLTAGGALVYDNYTSSSIHYEALTGTCSYTSCCPAPGGDTVPWAGACPVFDGNSCSTNTDCWSNNCNSSTHICGDNRVPDGFSCSGDGDCINGACNPGSNICGDNSCLPSQSNGCSLGGYQCCSGYCQGGQCQPELQ